MTSVINGTNTSHTKNKIQSDDLKVLKLTPTYRLWNQRLGSIRISQVRSTTKYKMVHKRLITIKHHPIIHTKHHNPTKRLKPQTKTPHTNNRSIPPKPNSKPNTIYHKITTKPNTKNTNKPNHQNQNSEHPHNKESMSNNGYQNDQNKP